MPRCQGESRVDYGRISLRDAKRADSGCGLPAAPGIARSALVRLLLLLIRVYRFLLSPALGRCCRFSPSCSEYAAQSLIEHGLVKGGGRALWRLLRCHPFSRGGYDPP